MDSTASIDKAKHATYACLRLVLINTQIVINTTEPVKFYTEMDEEDFKLFNNLLHYLHDNGVEDLSPILPYIS